MMKNVSIFIPSYNAQTTLYHVVKRIPATLWQHINAIYMINDGSRDETMRVMNEIAAEFPCCQPVDQAENVGYGETVKHGLALCRSDGCEFAVCLHADGQYPPESIQEGIGVMKRVKADILQGSRIASGSALKGGMPLYKYVAGRVLTIVENIVFNLSLTDYHSGFMIYSRKALDVLQFQNLSRSFDFDLEVIASARATGISIDEFPIPAHYGAEVSYLNPVTYGFRVLWVLCKYIAGRYTFRTTKKGTSDNAGNM